MKKFFIPLVLIMSVLFYTASAEPVDRISPLAKEGFKREFAGAQLLDWQAIKGHSNIYQVRFLYGNSLLNAFFDEEGVLLGTGRAITQAALPIIISKTIASSYNGYDVNSITEYSDTSETSYLVEIENAKSKKLVRIYNSGNSQILKKEKKVSK